jgi:hypothetical protein
LVRQAHLLFEQGLPLADTLDRRLAIDIELFSRGGVAILDKIRNKTMTRFAPAARRQSRTRWPVAARRRTQVW